MILVDHQISQLCVSGMVDPFDPHLINPASLDLRIGNSALLETDSNFATLDLTKYSKSSPFWLYPGDCTLVATLEKLNIPNDICAQFALKSSRAREFYQHLLSGFVDPGFNNSVLTLELKNVSCYQRLPLYLGLRIGQLVFHELAAIPERSYADVGRYNNLNAVQGSLG